MEGKSEVQMDRNDLTPLDETHLRCQSICCGLQRNLKNHIILVPEIVDGSGCLIDSIPSNQECNRSVVVIQSQVF